MFIVWGKFEVVEVEVVLGVGSVGEFFLGLNCGLWGFLLLVFFLEV